MLAEAIAQPAGQIITMRRDVFVLIASALGEVVNMVVMLERGTTETRESDTARESREAEARQDEIDEDARCRAEIIEKLIAARGRNSEGEVKS